MPIEFELTKDAYKERKNLVFALWVSGFPLLLHLFSGTSTVQLSASASYLSSVVVFAFAYSGSCFLEEMDYGMPYATTLLVAFSALGIKYGTQVLFGDSNLFASANVPEAAVLTGVTAGLMSVFLFLDNPFNA